MRAVKVYYYIHTFLIFGSEQVLGMRPIWKSNPITEGIWARWAAYQIFG